VKSEGAVADQSDAAVEAFQAPVGQAELDGRQDAVAMAAQRPGGSDEGLQP
jgi:hypothetical protein